MYNNASPIVFAGNLTEDPRPSTINGKNVAFLTIAQNPWSNDNNKEPKAHFREVAAFNSDGQCFAENIVAEYHKGDAVLAVCTIGHVEEPALDKNGAVVMKRDQTGPVMRQVPTFALDEIGHRTKKRPANSGGFGQAAGAPQGFAQQAPQAQGGFGAPAGQQGAPAQGFGQAQGAPAPAQGFGQAQGAPQGAPAQGFGQAQGAPQGGFGGAPAGNGFGGAPQGFGGAPGTTF